MSADLDAVAALLHCEAEPLPIQFAVEDLQDELTAARRKIESLRAVLAAKSAENSLVADESRTGKRFFAWLGFVAGTLVGRMWLQ